MTPPTAMRFAAAVRERTGESLEILSGEEEGRIAYLGATAELDGGPYVVCDIGGGSTELSLPRDAVSLDIGSVRLKERCLHADPPTEAEIGRARSTIDDALDTVTLDVRGDLVGVAGTITTLAAVVLGLDTYDKERVHLSVLSSEQVRETTQRLLAMSADEIVALGSVERGRSDVIGGGALILDRVMTRWTFAARVGDRAGHPRRPGARPRRTASAPTGGSMSNKFDVTGKVAIVTGGNVGIGQVDRAARSSRRAASVVTCSRRDYESPPAAEGLDGVDGRIIHMTCDVREADQIEAVVDRAVDGVRTGSTSS